MSSVSPEQIGGAFLVPGSRRIRFLPEAELDGKAVKFGSWKPVRGGFSAQSAEGDWILKARDRGGGTEVVLSARLRLVPRLVVLRPLCVRSWPGDHLATHGRKMGGCGLYELDQEAEESFASHFYLAITRGGVTTLLSHPLAQTDLSRFTGRRVRGAVRELVAETRMENNRARRVRSAPVTISSGNGLQLLEHWADAQVTVTEPLPVPKESGWNSFDYYRWTITEDEVLKNAECIASDPVLSRHVKRIIVDDGWQYCYGEWEANSLFPSGTKNLARSVRRMGLVPGLWFAPTIVEPHARLAQLEPECLANGASGFPSLAFSCMERKGFLLDPTHPKVIAEWSRVYSRYRQEGFTYFKLDFMAWTVANRTFWDRNAKPGELMRRIIAPIRAAVGPEACILGCNYNLENLGGLVDEVRVSSDIHAYWKCIKANAKAVASRFWAHRRLWINDPDFLVCRGDETASDPDLHRLKPMLPFVRPDDPNPSGMNYLDSLVDIGVREAETLASLVIVSGGSMNLADNLPRLNDRGIAILRKAVQAEKGNAAVPLDLFQSELPEQWVQRLDSGLHRVLLVNWSDELRTVSADLEKWNVPRAGLRNFWTDEAISAKAGRVECSLAPHSCLFLESHI